MSNNKITICRFRNADKYLKDEDFDLLISMGWNGEQHATERARFNFLADYRDVSPVSFDKYGHELLEAPNMVADLIRFARDDVDGLECYGIKILAHCQAGQSRSTAMLLIFLVAFWREHAHDPTGEFDDKWKGELVRDAISDVYGSRGKHCQPNWYLLAIADQLMNTNILGECRSQGRRLKTSRRDLTMIFTRRGKWKH